MVIVMNLLRKININKIKNFIIENKYIIFISIPLIAMDIITRLFGNDINFYKIYRLPPNLFTLSWITLFVGLSLGFKKKIGKRIYLITNIIFLLAFLTNNVYYSMTKTFFDFNLLESASEGAPYIIDALKNCNILVYVTFIIIIYLIYYGYKKIPYKTKNNKKIIFSSIIIFLLLHTLTPLTLGKANSTLTWSSWKNPRNIYISFNDNNKSMKVSGLEEYTIRNFYVTFIKTEKDENAEDINFLEMTYADSQKSNNKYTGMFKGKNLIFVQLEGLDNWLLTKENTPTLYKLMNEGINFNNHYSYYNGGGSTFNSEFAVNTGFITPLSYTQNAYTFNKNYFPYSMAHLYKSLGYTVNAFHMNTGEYYWGYDNYYGLIDIEKYHDDSYTLDRELILNKKFNELIFPNDTSFVDYIITYSGHLPFTNTKGVCKLLYNLDNPKDEEEKDKSKDETFVEMTEEECTKRQAKETDYMFELLLKNLEEKNMLDNTVLVVFTDHYLYTLEDKTILDKYKQTSNNLINKTPFFIWSKETKKTTINNVTSQLNILPTVLNLFGIDYNPNYYIGSDALDLNYKGLVFYNDYSWYDGNVYVENGEVANNKYITYEKLEQNNYYVANITKKNDLTLKYNYFKQNKEASK